MKLNVMKVKFKVKATEADKTGLYNLYCFRIHTIDRTLGPIRRWWSWAIFVIKNCHRDISENSRPREEEIG